MPLAPSPGKYAGPGLPCAPGAIRVSNNGGVVIDIGYDAISKGNRRSQLLSCPLSFGPVERGGLGLELVEGPGCGRFTGQTGSK